MAEWVRMVRESSTVAKRKSFLIFKYYRICDFEIYGTTHPKNISKKGVDDRTQIRGKA